MGRTRKKGVEKTSHQIKWNGRRINESRLICGDQEKVISWKESTVEKKGHVKINHRSKGNRSYPPTTHSGMEGGVSQETKREPMEEGNKETNHTKERLMKQKVKFF